MIHQLHHIEFDLAGGPGAWAQFGRLLGLAPASVPQAGSDPLAAVPSLIALDNVRLVARTALDPDATAASGASAPRAPLSALAFEVADFDRTLHLFKQRALRPEEGDASRLAHLSGAPLRVADLGPQAGFGVPLRIVGAMGAQTRAAADGPAPGAEAPGRVTGIDHVVVRTADPERAVATYAGRLGLSLRLDRSEPAWGVRLLFFRCGDMIVEVAHALKGGAGATVASMPTASAREPDDRHADGRQLADRIEAPAGPRDELWGITWRTDDMNAAHARLQGEGIEVSEIRTGRRPGTRVFTVRSHTGGVPTLLIGA